MIFGKYFRKLVGWCPMRTPFQKGKQEECFSDSRLENGSFQQNLSPTYLQERKILKAQVNVFPEWWAVIIISSALIVSLLLWTYSPEDSFLIVLSELILYLPLILLLFSHYPSTVTVMPDKIIIKRSLRKPVVIEKENIRQISIEKNENRSLRWPMRLVFLATLPVILLRTVERIIRNLQLEEAASASAKLGLFLSHSLVATYLLVFFYNFELRAPYQRILKVTMYSNLKLWIYTEEPEELTKLLNFEI